MTQIEGVNIFTVAYNPPLSEVIREELRNGVYEPSAITIDNSTVQFDTELVEQVVQRIGTVEDVQLMHKLNVDYIEL